MNFKPWAILSFVTFQMFFMIVNESERIRSSQEINNASQALDKNYDEVKAVGKKIDCMNNDFINHKHIYHDGSVILPEELIDIQNNFNESKLLECQSR